MRLIALKAIYYLLLVAISLRLFYWQVIRSDDLSARAEQQHLVNTSINAPRGLILSSDEAILASNRPSYLLYALPKLIMDKEGVAKKIASIIGEEDEFYDLADTIRFKLSQDLYWVMIDKNVDFMTKKELEKLNIRGLGFENRLSRLYPEASSAGQLLGFVGADQIGRQTGYFGVEGFYDRELRGSPGELTEEKDAQGLPILVGRFFKKEPKNGHDLILHLDRTIQYIVEKRLKSGIERYGAKSGSVVVMDPRTGAILAMASFPNYDPNSFVKFSKDFYQNPIVGGSFEPGSIFKPVAMAAAINEKVVEPDTRCDICDGPVRIADYQIKTWNNKYYPETSMTEVLTHSDNTGLVFLARKLGMDKMYRYIQDFGFGAVTNIDLQDEINPPLRSKNEWREIDLATASFGQGIAVTAIQMVRAIGAIANSGYLMEPHIVAAVRMEDRVKKIEPRIVGQPISQETAKTVTEMMVEAVQKGETKNLAPKGFKIAGKTGTAQIPVAGHYDPTKTIATFVGFAPADNPKFVMLVRYTEPSASIFGADTAAPTFFEIAKEILIYYNIAPES